MENKKFYMTTAIAYASRKPHFGNTYEIIMADAFARFQRSLGKDVFLCTGTDEHGQKIENLASEAGMTPKAYVDKVAGEIKGIWDLMGASYDHFIRTPDAIKAIVTIELNGEKTDIAAEGNGRLDAVSNAFKKHLKLEYSNLTYTEHALTSESSAKAVTYVSITGSDGKTYWGVGVHDDIIAASICALVSAINRDLDA